MSGIPARIPFVLFKRQEEFIEFLYECLKAGESGLVEKCRDVGVTWLCCTFSVWIWIYYPGASIGWGSRKEQLVDKIGDPDSIFEKMRMLIRGLPKEFLPVGLGSDHMTYMKIINPENDATITGESGDNIGRGGRKLVYFKDESAHYERPELIEASLGDNTNVQIDLSSVNGLNNVFHRRREAGVDWSPGQDIVKGRTNVFVFDWRDHPAKTQEWYDTRKAKAENDGLLHVFMQEVERNYAASVEGVIIKAEWVLAAIDAHLKIPGLDDSGPWGAALDVADEGADTNALAKRKGCILKSVDEWGARDTGITARRAVDACKNLEQIDLQYDCVGIGSNIKAETNRLIEENLMPKNIFMVPWNAGGEVLNKDKRVIVGDRSTPLNGDLFTNMKAQAWWMVARRFERTWRAIQKINGVAEQQNFTWEADDLISIDSKIPLLRKIQKELSQATMGQGGRLKMLVDKAPDGTKSPNLADAIIMAFFPLKSTRPMVFSDDVLRWASQRG